MTIAAASGPASSRRSSASPAGAIASSSRSVSSAHRRGEALAHGVEPERPGERRAVAPVLGAVEREHARPDDLAGGEARVVDGERLGVAHHLHGEVAPRDEPAAERGQPGDRLVLAQPREQRVRVGLELGERAAAPDRERRRARVRSRESCGAAALGARAHGAAVQQPRGERRRRSRRTGGPARRSRPPARARAAASSPTRRATTRPSAICAEAAAVDAPRATR